MAVVNLIDDTSYVYIENSSNFSSNITPTGLQDTYSNSNNHINFSLRRNDGADPSKACLFPQYYNTSYSQWIAANYQALGGQTFIDNLASWSGITLPSGSNNQYLCIPYNGPNTSIDLTQAYWTSLGNNTFTYSVLKPYASINSTDSGSGDIGSDYSQISNAIYYLGATILVVCFFSVIYKMFIRLRG